MQRNLQRKNVLSISDLMYIYPCAWMLIPLAQWNWWEDKLLKILRIVAVTWAACLASAGLDQAAAFGRSAISGCSGTPARCATGVPVPTGKSRQEFEIVKAEPQKVKYVLFGTNRRINEIDKSHRSLYKISSMFSDEMSTGVAMGAVERFVNKKSGRIILNTASIEFFNDASEITSYIEKIGMQGKKPFIYVHGVNNSFDSAVNDATLISGIVENEFIPVCFIWPSKVWRIAEKISGRGYDLDKQINEESISFFDLFFKKINMAGMMSLDIFAHSRGSYLVTRFAERHILAGASSIRSVILAAPDLSKSLFYEFVSQIKDRKKFRITIYTSKDDGC